MKLTIYRDAREFEAATQEFLLANEAANNLILGLTSDLIYTTLYRNHPPYLATIEDGGKMIGAALRTPPHNLQLSLAPVEVASLLAADVHREHADLPGVGGQENLAAAFADAWQKLTGRQPKPGTPQHLYQATTIVPPSGVPGEMRPAERSDNDLILQWVMGFEEEAFGRVNPEAAARRTEAYFEGGTRGLYIWYDGEPVSMAGYGGLTPNGIRIGPVYTPPEHRRRGYGTALSAALSQRLLDEGRSACFLFTDRNNPTPNHIYQQIGYERVMDVNEYRFE